MTDLQKLALVQIQEMTDIAKKELTKTILALMATDAEFNPDEHIYPVQRIINTINEWAEAILESEEE